MLSQIVRLSLSQASLINHASFRELRRKAATKGAVSQYYGYTIQYNQSPLPKLETEVCWLLNWPRDADQTSAMNDLSQALGDEATSLLLQFDDSQIAEVTKALEGPICELACIRLSDNTELSNKSLQQSMHKTYADTYRISGFTGGSWSYALNTNNSSGAPLAVSIANSSRGTEPRLGVYVLGWESIEHHQAATKTPEFAEELLKLMPHFGPGTGAWYVAFEKHS